MKYKIKKKFFADKLGTRTAAVEPADKGEGEGEGGVGGAGGDAGGMVVPQPSKVGEGRRGNA